MAVLNDVVAEHPVTEENYFRAANFFTNMTKARVFIGMELMKRVRWSCEGLILRTCDITVSLSSCWYNLL
jgi:hypothetical protein